MARIIAAKLAPLLGQEVLVDNRAGANGAVASEYVAGAAPDGQTLMFGYVGTHAMNPALQKLGYDPVADFAPIGLVGSSPTLMVAHPDLQSGDVPALVAALRAQPGRYACASAGEGTPPHFAAALFQLATGARMAGSTYQGAAPAIADTASGRTQIMFPSLFTAHPFVHSGRLRALAVAGPQRLPGLPDVPTLAEAGVPGVDVTQWYGLFAPARTPHDRVDTLNQALNQVLADPAVVQLFEQHGARVEAGTPQMLAARVQADLARWQAVVAQGGLAVAEQRAAALE
jgi:tripartite-type tricarboxylate transporter receptor subunit TctC